MRIPTALHGLPYNYPVVLAAGCGKLELDGPEPSTFMQQAITYKLTDFLTNNSFFLICVKAARNAYTAALALFTLFI